MRIIIILTCIILFLVCESFYIPKNYQRYIDTHLLKAQHLEQVYGIPVSIQMAQAIWESGGGRSNIAKEAKNHFGIRCGDDWDGQRYCSPSGCWRKYETVQDSWIDHAKFIARYYPNAKHKNWEFYAKLEGYGGAGYWSKICKIVKRYKLYKYDYICN